LRSGNRNLAAYHDVILALAIAMLTYSEHPEVHKEAYSALQLVTRANIRAFPSLARMFNTNIQRMYITANAKRALRFLLDMIELFPAEGCRAISAVADSWSA